jgi:hypothetical protein
MYRRLFSAAVILGMVALAVLLYSCGQQSSSVEKQEPTSDRSQPTASRPKPPAGVQDIDVGPAGYHITGNWDYDKSLGTPPAGGPHNPRWQNCGFYGEPVRDENAVHSLEHGAVWITYRPDLSHEEIERLSDMAKINSYVLVSPYSDQDSPVVATAWGKQLTLESAEDPDLERFVEAYSRSPQAPGPAAASATATAGGGHDTCTGGVGQPK